MTRELSVAVQLTKYLRDLGVDIVFGLCGHTNIAFIDALGHSEIRFISSRHEQVAAHMADGYARVSGKPGVLLTHLGPGISNATTGVANAALDAVPLVVIAGDVPTHFFGRHPHQEINLHHDADQYEIFRPFCKRIWRIERPDQVPRVIERAFHIAQSGKPGAVLVDVPMDIFSKGLPFAAFNRLPPKKITKPKLNEEDAEQIATMLLNAKRPLMHVGSGVLRDQASMALLSLAEHLQSPVTYTLMGKGAMPDAHPLNAGMTGFWGSPLANELCRTADVILAVGTRLAEADSSSWDPRFTFSVPPTRLIHIDIDYNELGRNLPTEIGVISDSRLALDAILQQLKRIQPEAKKHDEIIEKIRRGKAEFSQLWQELRNSDQFPLRPERILADVRDVLPDEGLLVTDVGWNKNGVGQQFTINIPGTFITPGAYATMGFGPAAALGVKLAQPEKPVLALVGDGAFSSNMSVVATAMEAEIPIVWLVMDNKAFGTIALLEDHHYGWSYGCTFERRGEPYSVDYAAVARACGAQGINITKASELAPALHKALSENLPSLIQVPMENVPTPTPGYWNINDIYQTGM